MTRANPFDAIEVDEALCIAGHLLEHRPTTGDFARDDRGEAVFATDRNACCWCLVGALRVVAGRGKTLAIIDRARALLGGRRDLDVAWDEDESFRQHAIQRLKRAGLGTATLYGSSPKRVKSPG